MSTPIQPPPGTGACASGKLQYANRKQAKIARGHIGDHGLRIYRCECGWLHLGHMPRAVRNGTIDKAAWLAEKEQA